jgi:hypothetical protein
MTRLPRELAPWAPFLEAFPDEEVQAIWPWLPRLNTLLGSVHVDSERESGESDGYDGLTRRGIYDRLLTDEWALLELLPEEFIRRAAMNEQYFIKPARKSPQEAKRSVMLFDAGPDQLGAPRLVHLALLMIMARRARASRTSFAWGILQNPAKLSEGFSAEHLALLVSARTWDAPGAQHIDLWKESLSSANQEDLWIVGSSSLLQLPKPHFASMIVVNEPFEIPATHLSVSVARYGNAPHTTVRLELPAHKAGVRLLRASAYKIAATRLEEQSVSTAIQLSWNGRRLLTRGPNSTIFAYHIPNSSREPQGETLQLSPDPSESIIAATVDGKMWSYVTIKDNRIFCYGPRTKNTRGGFECGSLPALPIESCVQQLIPCNFGARVPGSEPLSFQMRYGIAFSDGRQGLVLIYDKTVQHMTSASFCVDFKNRERNLIILLDPSGEHPLLIPVHGLCPERSFDFGGDGTFEFANHYGFPRRTFGINDIGRRWRFCSLDQDDVSMQFDIEQPPGSRVIGWMPSGWPDWEKEPRLLCCSEESGLIMSVSEKRTVILYNAFAPIRSCLHHPIRAIIAMSTDTDLIVFSLSEHCELLRIRKGQA